MSELNPYCGAIYVKTFRPSYSAQRRTDFEENQIIKNPDWRSNYFGASTKRCVLLIISYYYSFPQIVSVAFAQ